MTIAFRTVVALRWLTTLAVLIVATHAVGAVTPETIHDLALGEGDARATAIAAIVTSGDPSALSL
jgi:predicted cobalt transporter CbtA